MLTVLEASIRLQRTQECLLERIVGSLGTDATPKQPKYLGTMLLVEAFEGRYRHARHIVF
jgi:hypothetical protein